MQQIVLAITFEPQKKVVYTHEQALEALQHYCAYQDRCHKEAREKLHELGYYGDDAEVVIVDLIKDKYLDEERYARSFARGKFKMKRWGKYKITAELKKRHIGAYCIKKGISEIDDDEYYTTMCNELRRRNEVEKAGQHPYHRRRGLADYMFKRGYESSMVWEAIKELEL